MHDRPAARDAALTLRSGMARTHTDRPYMPPQRVLDEIAERTLTGGYNVKPTNLCGTCHTFRSAVGDCLC